MEEMTTIEEAAKKLADTLAVEEPKGLVYNAFKEGAKWALQNQWHDASKELPYKYSECFEENESNYTKDILCCSKKGIYYTDYMFKSRISKEWSWSQKNSYDCKYWMPISNIPKELK